MSETIANTLSLKCPAFHFIGCFFLFISELAAKPLFAGGRVLVTVVSGEDTAVKED